LSINNNDTSTDETDSVNGAQSGEEIQENGKMYTIAENKTVYIGKKINTNVNTYLISEYDSGKVLAGKNIDVVRPAASFVKVMTAYELMYEGLNLAGQTTFTNNLKSKYHSFKTTEGEIFSNKDLLDALLVSSINTPAKMLVSSIEKKESSFVKRMNERVKEWGLKNTKFVDVDGYDIKNITTARDYLSLYTRAERVREVREALAKKQYVYYEIKDLNKTAKHSDVHSNLLMNKPGLVFKIISSKTGYLNEAGSGLVMLIERPKDGKQFIIITMGNPDYTHRFVEPERLANFAISNF
jgi:D-alanyl-D-alanine carboxypeptidase